MNRRNYAQQPNQQNNRIQANLTNWQCSDQDKKYVQLYFFVAWMLQFVLAAKDSSKCIDTPISIIIFSFRTWLWVDGGTTIFTMILICCMKFNNSPEALTRFKILFYLYLFSFLCKIVWFLVGTIYFLSLNFSQCSNLLLDFMVVYFISAYSLAFKHINSICDKMGQVELRQQQSGLQH